jgi:predicted metal-dependent phosphoesterase TrpH
MTAKQNNYKIDLHTHSTLSHDGGISEKQYLKVINKGKLDYIAITDHNEVDYAVLMNRKHGDQFIVGEEIQTGKGEIVGLFLTKKIEPHLGIKKTIAEIREQGGLVYIPHPFDIRRSGITKLDLEKIIEEFDILEAYNARVITPLWSRQIKAFNEIHKKPTAAGSDAHSASELGRTFTMVNQKPTKSNLISMLKSPEYKSKRVGVWGFIAPKRNKLKKLLTDGPIGEK